MLITSAAVSFAQAQGRRGRVAIASNDTGVARHGMPWHCARRGFVSVTLLCMPPSACISNHILIMASCVLCQALPHCWHTLRLLAVTPLALVSDAALL